MKKLLLILFLFISCIAKSEQIQAQERYLLVGDSLTAQYFGAEMYDLLCAKEGKNNVAVYGSCGASPESYMPNHRSFTTPCGFRQQAPDISSSGEGRKLTPKINVLIKKYKPTTIILVLGTNWFDGLATGGGASIKGYGPIVDNFIHQIRGYAIFQKGSAANWNWKKQLKNVRIVWVTPPDCARFRNVQNQVTNLLIQKSKTDGFDIFDSSKVTHYTRKVSGPDGTHYYLKPAQDWAQKVFTWITAYY